MDKKNVIILLITGILSLSLPCFIDFSGNKIINYEFLINAEITLFSVSLAIVALMITILEKYKEKSLDNANWAKKSSSILKEISENTVILLFIVIILIMASLFKTVIALIPKIHLMDFILLFSLFVSLMSIFDTTISVHKLVSGLKDILLKPDAQNISLSKEEIDLVNAYRFLDNAHKKEFESLTQTLTLKQQLDIEQNKTSQRH